MEASNRCDTPPSSVFPFSERLTKLQNSHGFFRPSPPEAGGSSGSRAETFAFLAGCAASSLAGVFTGIVEELGRVVSLDSGAEQARLSVAAPELAPGLEPGDSVAVDGCCLTVVAKKDDTLVFDVSAETLSRSSIGNLGTGSGVNLEAAVRAGEPLGGHYVQGHVDAVGRVRSLSTEGEGVRMWIEVPPQVLRYCIEKGSLAVAGVSLTIAELGEDAVSVALIPYTLEQTTLGKARPGEPVNLEADVIAKYVERLLEGRREE
jgi:riboflavin synthase